MLTSGTYLRGRIIIGDMHYRRPAASWQAKGRPIAWQAGLELLRFKTGTPARVHRDSIDFMKTIIKLETRRLHSLTVPRGIGNRSLLADPYNSRLTA